MATDLKQIALRLQPALLEQIDEAAGKQGLDRSSFIRQCCAKVIAGENPSRNTELISQVEVVDERAREIVRDLLKRVERLERMNNPDPFA